jgi:hypothetical protein
MLPFQTFDIVLKVHDPLENKNKCLKFMKKYFNFEMQESEIES